MTPLFVTAIINFLRPNLTYWFSDIVNLANDFRSIFPNLLKSSNDSIDSKIISVRSEIYSLTLKAMNIGAFINFSAMLISKYVGDNKFLWYSLSKWSLKLYFMNRTFSIDDKPYSLFHKFFSTPFSTKCADKVKSLYWMTKTKETDVFYKKKIVLIFC